MRWIVCVCVYACCAAFPCFYRTIFVHKIPISALYDSQLWLHTFVCFSLSLLLSFSSLCSIDVAVNIIIINSIAGIFVPYFLFLLLHFVHVISFKLVWVFSFFSFRLFPSFSLTHIIALFIDLIFDTSLIIRYATTAMQRYWNLTNYINEWVRAIYRTTNKNTFVCEFVYGVKISSLMRTKSK